MNLRRRSGLRGASTSTTDLYGLGAVFVYCEVSVVDVEIAVTFSIVDSVHGVSARIVSVAETALSGLESPVSVLETVDFDRETMRSGLEIMISDAETVLCELETMRSGWIS